MNAFAPIKEAPPSAPVAPAPAPANPSPVKMHWEAFWLGLGYDFFIVFICLCSLYLAALEDEHAALFFIVVRAGLAVCELFRAPLAMMSRVHGSATWRSLCVSGVFALALVTAFNLWLPMNKGMRDAIAPVQEAGATLEAVEAIPAQLQKEVESKREIWNGALARVKDDNGAIGNQAAEHCWNHRCKNNARGNELAAASSAVKAAEKAFNDAATAAQKWNKGGGADALRKARENYRKAANKNWVYGAVATLLRIDAEKISPSGMSLALNALSIPFCLLAGMTGSLICLASVERLPRPKAEKMPDGEDTIKISGAGMCELAAAVSEYGKTLRDADDVLQDDSAPPEHSAPAKVEPPAPPSVPNGETLLLPQAAMARRAANGKAKRGRKNAAFDGRTRQGKAAKRKAESKTDSGNVVSFPSKAEIHDDDIPF